MPLSCATAQLSCAFWCPLQGFSRARGQVLAVEIRELVSVEPEDQVVGQPTWAIGGGVPSIRATLVECVPAPEPLLPFDTWWARGGGFFQIMEKLRLISFADQTERQGLENVAAVRKWAFDFAPRHNLP